MTRFDQLNEYFQCRPCWICQSLGFCRHREVNVALAEIGWMEEHRPKIEPGRETESAGQAGKKQQAG